MFCPVSLTAEAEPEPYRYVIKRECFCLQRLRAKHFFDLYLRCKGKDPSMGSYFYGKDIEWNKQKSGGSYEAGT